MDFALDTKAAASYGKGSSFISDSGAYVGTLIRAADAVSAKGTQGVDLMFRTNSGDTADYITIWHTKADGERLSGFEAINALMTCLKLRGAKKGQHNTEKWNKATKSYEKIQMEGYPDFCNKPLGIVLQATLESDQNGADRQGKQIIGFFDPATRLTAAEILNKATKAEALDKQLEYLLRVPVKDLRKGGSRPATSKSQSAPAGNGFADFDDDIPF